MNSLPARRCRLTLRKPLRPKKSKKPSVRGASTPYTPPSSAARPSSSSSSDALLVPKPLRPLTAYHIFFQIEREYVIQTASGPPGNDVDIHANKSYLPDVPHRYRWTRLSADWYAGPGKRKKRKHRKSHGKIGFLELSRIVSRRWATLDCDDPETKRYVTSIAARELEEYKEEMRQYKRLVEGMAAPAAPTPAGGDANENAPGAMISPVASPGPARPSPRPRKVSSSTPPPSMPQLQRPMEQRVSAPAAVQSMRDLITPFSFDDDDDEIDYSICSVSISGNYIPSPGPPATSCGESNMIQPDGTICDPLFELDGGCGFQRPVEKRCVSPLSSETNTDGADVISSGACFRLSSR